MKVRAEIDLEYILELIIKSKLRLEDSHINYALCSIDEAIIEIKKLIEDSKATKGMNAPAIAKEEKVKEIMDLKK